VIESRNELGPWLPWCHPAYSEEDSRSWVETQVSAFRCGIEYAFVICGEGGRFLGGCGLNHLDRANRRANLGYWVRTSTQRHGVATRATKLLADWAFDQTDFNRLEVVCSVRNLASQRVAERAGARKEGVLRSRLLLNGEFHDAILYAIIRTGTDGPSARPPAFAEASAWQA